MTGGKELTPFGSTDTPTDAIGYKRTRLALATMLESYTSDKGRALDLLERWERGVWACVHLNQPTASAAKDAFAVAAEEFLK